MVTSFRFPSELPSRAEEALELKAERSPAPEPRSHVFVPPLRIVGRTKGNNLVFIQSNEIWAFEAQAGVVYIHAPAGRFDIERSLSEVQATLGPTVLRVHRNWLAAVAKVRELRVTSDGTYLFAGDWGDSQRGVELPVARERVGSVRRVLLADAFGLRVAKTSADEQPQVTRLAYSPSSGTFDASDS